MIYVIETDQEGLCGALLKSELTNQPTKFTTNPEGHIIIFLDVLISSDLRLGRKTTLFSDPGLWCTDCGKPVLDELNFEDLEVRR